MLNKLKAIVAKPPTSNRKFHRDTEDVLNLWDEDNKK